MIHENVGWDKSSSSCQGFVDKRLFSTENEDWCVKSAIVNTLMMLSTPLEITFLICLLLHVFVGHLLCAVPPWGQLRSVKEINTDQSLMLLVLRSIIPQQDFLNHISACIRMLLAADFLQAVPKFQCLLCKRIKIQLLLNCCPWSWCNYYFSVALLIFMDTLSVKGK